MKKIALPFLIALLMWGCADESVKNDSELFSVSAYQGEALRLDPKTENVLAPNQQATLFLNQQAGNGFMWFCKSQDEKVVKILENKIIVPKQTKISEHDFFVGGKILSIWKLEAVAPGKTLVHCKHYREWEGEKSTVEESQINLTVK